VKFKHLVLAGTFDHLHQGHKSFIQTALNQSKTVFCGLTTKWVEKNKTLATALQSFNQRYSSLKKFLKTEQQGKKVKIFPLNDCFGPAIYQPSLEAIAATKESLAGAQLVNKKRKENNLSPLPIIISPLIRAQDKKIISSTRIRLGEINRQGLVYSQLLPTKKTLFLPDSQRHFFKKPIGRLFKGPNHHPGWASFKISKQIKKDPPSFIVAVGDIASQSLLLRKITPDLAIIDYRCQRQPISFNLHHQLKKRAVSIWSVKNKPGTLSGQAIKACQKIFPQLINHQPQIIQVKGEEDLLTLIAILFSPLKTSVIYGQPGKGLVQVKVTEKTKEKALQLVKKFIS